jgi:MFS transporter, MHS family, proline/betaine transporter
MSESVNAKVEPPAGIRTVAAGVVGNVLEWYDFALYGFFAPTIGRSFFPSESRVASLLATYGVFALAFAMRPLGGLIFGHIGDRIGRKKALELSVLLMAVPTTLLGLLPTYHDIGVAAPILLTLIRALQGISVGGEFIGSISFLGEHASARRRGLLGSWTSCSATAGTLLGSVVAAMVNASLPHQWGWRVPFCCGIVVGLAGLWLRRDISESPDFVKAAREGVLARSPALEALRHDRGAVLQTFGLGILMSVGFYMPFVWLPTWLGHLREPPLPGALTSNAITLAALAALLPIGGWLSDRMGRRRTLCFGAIAHLVIAVPLFTILEHGAYASALAAQVGLAVAAAIYFGPCPAAFVELFPTRTRYSGVAMGYNAAQALCGGTAPLIATWLVHATGTVQSAAIYLMAAAAASLAAALGMIDRAGRPLPGDRSCCQTPGASDSATP